MNWKYYNHALVPTTAPHIPAYVNEIENGNLWKQFPNALFARWTSDFDCGYETNWWYVIKDKPINLNELSSHARKHIRKGLKRCRIETVNGVDYAESLYECSCAAFSKYKNATNDTSKEQFFKDCSDETSVYWAGFDEESGKLIGFLRVRPQTEHLDIVTAKFDPNHLNTHISDALYYTVINHYLSDCGLKYVSSGQRNINHVTNSQEYKEQTLGYRKAYCKLNIKYKTPVDIAVKILYPFRKLLQKLDKIGIIHQINAILKMEEIVRE